MLYNTNYLKINSSIGFSVYKKVISQNGYRWLVLFFFQKTLNSFTDVVIIQMTTFQGFQQIILYKACLLTFTNSFIEFIWIYIISRSCIRSRHSHSILIKTEEFLTKSIHDNYTEDIFLYRRYFTVIWVTWAIHYWLVIRKWFTTYTTVNFVLYSTFHQRYIFKNSSLFTTANILCLSQQ